jgi:hypothetical protein
MQSVLNILVSILFVSVNAGSLPNRTSNAPDYVGEVMHYNVKYGIIRIGIASISCIEDPEGCGHLIRAEAQSAGLLKLFKNLSYRFECCMDPATGLPKSAEMDLRDRNTIAYNKVLFDHYSRTDSSIIIKDTSEKWIVPKNTHDLLTAYYHFRKDHYYKSLNARIPFVMQIYIADMLWDLKMTYKGGETISTIYGQTRCDKFTSSTVVGPFFRNDDDMTVWFTRDKIPIPVKIKMNLKLGSINGELEAYQSPADH